MAHKIAQLALVVRDYDEALTFYVEFLGWECVEDTDLGGGKRWVRVRPRDTTGPDVLLSRAVNAEQRGAIGNQSGGRVFLFLETDDFWSEFDRLTSRGVHFVREPKAEPYGLVAVFEDLYGNRFDLIERR